MRFLLPILAAIALAEAGAYAWMHPAKDPNAQPLKVLTLDWDGLVASYRTPAAEGSTNQSLTSSSAAITPLPDEAAVAIADLKCSSGEVASLSLLDGSTLYLAWFEWNQESRANISEVYKHAPEICMGALGMKVIGFEPSRSLNLSGTSLSFDHTRFRADTGSDVHVFKSTWLSGLPDNLEAGFRSPRERRLHIAKSRAEVSHARVLMATFHGAADGDAAWGALEQILSERLTLK